jgi:hypothetical protein
LELEWQAAAQSDESGMQEHGHRHGASSQAYAQSDIYMPFKPQKPAHYQLLSCTVFKGTFQIPIVDIVRKVMQAIAISQYSPEKLCQAIKI